MLNSANVFIQYISHPVINKNFSHIQFLLQNLLINIIFLISYVTVAGASAYSAGFTFNPAARIASTTKFFLLLPYRPTSQLSYSLLYLNGKRSKQYTLLIHFQIHLHTVSWMLQRHSLFPDTHQVLQYLFPAFPHYYSLIQ